MAGAITGPLQNIRDTVGQIPGQPQQPRQPQGGFPQFPGFPGFPGFPRFPRQGQTPTTPGFNPRPLPEGYQSQYGNYGFDPQLQNYLDQQYVASTRDAGVGFQYNPTNQTFTGATMGGMYNPIPLNVMQQAAGGNRDVLNPYFQSRFPQQPGSPLTPGPNTAPPGQQVIGFRTPRQGQTLSDYNIYGPINPPVNPGMQPVAAVAQPPQQRGLGGLQVDKFRNRLG